MDETQLIQEAITGFGPLGIFAFYAIRTLMKLREKVDEMHVRADSLISKVDALHDDLETCKARLRDLGDTVTDMKVDLARMDERLGAKPKACPAIKTGPHAVVQ